jgi:hypothetical protein
MKILGCKRGQIFDIGFINPNTIPEVTVQMNAKDTEKILLRALIEQQNKREILFSYNFK